MPLHLGERTGSVKRSAPAGKGWLLAAAILTAIAVFVPQGAFAQVLYGTLTGNVTDESDAVVAGAKVQALNVATNVTSSTTTNERGLFRFSDLLPGEYQLTVEAPAFAMRSRSRPPE